MSERGNAAIADEVGLSQWQERDVDSIIVRLIRLRQEMLDLEAEARHLVETIPGERRQSARNLLHYVALRRRDIRRLQEDLVPKGLSSLGRCEAFVMANTEAVLNILRSLTSNEIPGLPKYCVPVDYQEAKALLVERSRALFGVHANQPAIMVTMPSEAANDYGLVRDLLRAGMSVMRINCAHDDPASWSAMIENLRTAEQETQRTCRIAMDLAGPKIRTGPIAEETKAIRLRKGDRVKLTSDALPARPPRFGKDGQQREVARIGCTLPEVFADVRVGDRVLFDDGIIAATIESVASDHLVLEVTRAKKKGQKLRAFKGINFPDSQLNLPALTDKDIADLEFITRFADIVNYSFVRRPADIQRLHEELKRLGRPELPVILKIENPQSFDNLPMLLLESMRRSPLTGVMIARGDLAVECGWERLVEVQEELLWMCEAAHVPVVWATQVLEGLAKNGLPTRAELTDAGAGSRAECVMLNKGPNIVEAVDCLYDILARMHEHQTKKRPMFRRLHVADRIASNCV